MSKVLKLAGQGSPIGGRVLRKDKSVRDTLLPLLEVSDKQHPNVHNTYTEYLVQNHVGFELASSVSVSLYESCIVHLVENLSPPILQGYTVSEMRTRWRSSIYILSMYSVLTVGQMQCFPPSSKGILSVGSFLLFCWSCLILPNVSELFPIPDHPGSIRHGLLLVELASS